MIRKASILVAAAFLLAAPARADTITIEQCVLIFNGLSALDQHVVIVKNDKGADEAKMVPYKLGAARLRVALNISALRPVAEATEKARQGLILELGGADKINANRELTKTFQEAWAKINEGPCSVTPGHISVSELHIGDDQNAIPVWVLSNLVPILDLEK